MGSKFCIVSIIFIVAGVTTLTTILTGSLWLAPEISNIIETECTISGCHVDADTCSTSHTSKDPSGRSYTYYTYYTCYRSKLEYYAKIDGETYSSGNTNTYRGESSAYGRCNDYPINSTITCYYNVEDPGDSLTSSRGDYYGGAIATVVIFGIFSLCIWSIGIFYYIKCVKPDYTFY